MNLIDILLILAGLVAGFIDSIAGGGGLITVPIFSLILGPGATAIGTNKIVALTAAGVALVVYSRAGHVSIKGNRVFAVLVGVGGLVGALVAPLIPPPAYRWIIVLIAPLILWIVFQKEIWVQAAQKDPTLVEKISKASLWCAGFACGLYDGVAGPGGGTLMFLSLFLFAKLPLLRALATAKVANVSSASVSLATYAATGHVLWSKGILMAMGIGFGAYLGATYATKSASGVARIALLIVATGLILKLAL